MSELILSALTIIIYLTSTNTNKRIKVKAQHNSHSFQLTE